MKRQKIISCLASSLISPTIYLYEKLNKTRFTGKSKIRKSTTESGYSCSIILQVVIIIESLTNRVRYFSKTNYRTNKRVKSLEFLKRYFNKESNLINKVEELFVLRDSIAHNHLWTIGYDLDKEYNEVKTYHKLLQIYGDSKFKRCINRKDRTTEILKLNVVPIKIGKMDVKKAFEVLKDFLNLLKNKNKINLTDYQIEYDNKFIKLNKFLEEQSKT